MSLTPEALLARARRCAESATLLLAAGDPSGACNRAYYGMFDAARAALSGHPAAVKSGNIRTHSGLITAFSLHLIKPGHIPTQYGRSFRQVDQIRLVADYSDEPVDLQAAASSIEQAVQFIAAVDRYLAGAA